MYINYKHILNIINEIQITSATRPLYVIQSRYDEGNWTPIALHTIRANNTSGHIVLRESSIGNNNIRITTNAQRPRNGPRTPEF